MARTKDDVQKAAAAIAATAPQEPKRRGRPAKVITDADTGAGVKKPAGKRGRPAGTSSKPKPATTASADGIKRRGRPPGSLNKTKTPGTKKSSAANKLREFLPAIPAEESTTGADRRRAKGAKLESLPDTKKVVNPNDGRRKNKGPPKGTPKGTPKGVTPKKKASSPMKRSSPAVGKASSPLGADAADKKSDASKENASQTPLFGGFKSMFG